DLQHRAYRFARLERRRHRGGNRPSSCPRPKESSMKDGQRLHPAAERPQVSASHAVKSALGILGSRLFGRDKPLSVNIEPTHRCNLDCPSCDKTAHDAPQMTTAEALALIDELADAGTLSVCFDGGEPLVHPGIGQMVRAARR